MRRLYFVYCISRIAFPTHQHSPLSPIRPAEPRIAYGPGHSVRSRMACRANDRATHPLPLTFTVRGYLPVKLDSKPVLLPLALQFPACAVCNSTKFIAPVFVGIFGVQGFAQVEME